MLNVLRTTLCLVLLAGAATEVLGQNQRKSGNTPQWDNLSSPAVPTVITSKTMSLNSSKKTFIYEGDVSLVKDDLKMNSKKLLGKYNESQGIDELTALEKVVITKGTQIKARSNKAVYDKKTETMILTEHPEVTQEESILTADVVRIFLKENRSLAEGNVRVKLIQKDE
jgi:lipopolysaccharide transport protein LptA